MTVSVVEQPQPGKLQYVCEWFDADLKRLSAIFIQPVLTPAPE
jgi:hypothetical protein